MLAAAVAGAVAAGDGPRLDLAAVMAAIKDAAQLGAAALHDAIKLAMEDPKVIDVRKKFSMEDRYMDTATYAKFNAELFEKEKKYLNDLGLARKD